MNVKGWLGKQMIRSIVGQIEFEEVRVNKWILALVAGLVVFFADAGLTGGLEAGKLPIGAGVAALAAGILAFTGKLYDPGATLAIPRLAKALALGIGAAVAMLGPAMADGVISAGEWGSIAVTLFTVAWAKWSTPDKFVS